jgi:iron complex outermembrane receptor protein
MGIALLLAASPALADGKGVEDVDLTKLSLEELGQLKVTSVSRRPEAVRDAAASVYVITRDDALRSGVQILPEALRLAPNLSVGRVDALDYGVTTRGMGGFESSNKLLVMIDGRSVYSPFFAGVEWSQQLIQLEDLDRIEVVSGPGGALWGANAVNGVVNVVTRSSADTQGMMVSAAVGSVDSSANLRYGGRLGENGAYRIFAGAYDRGDLRRIDGSDADDGYSGHQIGFRTDWTFGDANLTLQGDSSENTVDLLTGTPGPKRGYADDRNLLGRWEQRFDNDSVLTVQAYYDRYARKARGIHDSVETGDISVQYAFAIGAHRLVVGGGHRAWRDGFENFVNGFVLDPPSRDLSLSNLFVQDQIDLRDDLTLTLGVKGEDGTFTDTQWMPSARLRWRISDQAAVWGAVSRAVRNASRLDRDLVFPPLLVAGDFQPEVLVAYELGYRGQPTPRASLSATLFYHDYDGLRSTEPSPGITLPLFIGNGLAGRTYGLEAWSDFDVTARWRLSAGLNLLGSDFHPKAGSIDLSQMAAVGADPKVRLSLRSHILLTDRVTFNLALRHVGEIEDAPSDGLRDMSAYTQADARLAWQASDHVELSVTGFDLLSRQHADAPETRRNEVGRRVQAGLRWTW